MTQALDVIAIGNAIVDVLGHTDDAFLAAHGVPKGGMVLIDTEKAAAITDALPASDQVAGGSAGNSMACLASLGGRAGFIGKVGDDTLGDVYRASMRDIGVEMTTTAMTDGTPTGRCLIAVTPDAERSMATFLGAAGDVSRDDVQEDDIRRARVVYFEGYLFDGERPRSAFVAASAVAREGGDKAALTLSDVGVVERNRAELLQVLRDHVDILFANEAEAKVLVGSDGTPEELASALAQIVPFGAVTLSARGSIVFGPDTAPTPVPAVAPTQLVDTTGAGDAYAGGFLFGFTRGIPLDKCAAIGSLAASEVISHMGPRPNADLAQMARAEELI